MYSSSKEKVPPRTQSKIGSKKCMITNALVCIDCLPKGIKFNHAHFINNILEEISKFIQLSQKRIVKKKILFHIDNCPVHNGKKIIQFFTNKKLRIDHQPAYSPDRSP